ncbi:unnamed protein product, partial [Tilletia caries]
SPDPPGERHHHREHRAQASTTARLRGCGAAYILCPTSKNVEAIINDLAPDIGELKYAAGHIFFMDALSEPRLRRLTNSPAERKLKKLIELFVNIWPLELKKLGVKKAESLRDRANDCEARVLITTDEGKRGGRTIATKSIADAAVKQCPGIEHVIVVQRTGAKVDFDEKRDIWWHEAAAKERSYCPTARLPWSRPRTLSSSSTLLARPSSQKVSYSPPPGAGYLLGTALTASTSLMTLSPFSA